MPHGSKGEKKREGTNNSKKTVKKSSFMPHSLFCMMAARPANSNRSSSSINSNFWRWADLAELPILLIITIFMKFVQCRNEASRVPSPQKGPWVGWCWQNAEHPGWPKKMKYIWTGTLPANGNSNILYVQVRNSPKDWQVALASQGTRCRKSVCMVGCF